MRRRRFELEHHEVISRMHAVVKSRGRADAQSPVPRGTPRGRAMRMRAVVMSRGSEDAWSPHSTWNAAWCPASGWWW